MPTFKSSKFIEKTINELYNFISEKSFEKFEILIISDSGDSKTWELIKKLKEKYKFIRAFQLYKNFGQHYANHIGFIKSKGDFIITMDDDGQNPPDQIIKLIKAQRNTDADLVVGMYDKKKHSFKRKLGSILMNKIIKFIFKSPKNFRSSNFRLLSRKVVDRIVNSNPSFPYTTGQAILFSNIKVNISVTHRKGFRDKSSYGIYSLFSLAWNSIANYSNLPMRYLSYLGILFSIGSFSLFSVIILQSLIVGTSTPGWASICCLISFMSSMQFLLISLLCEYFYKLNISSKHNFENAINDYV